MHGLSPTELFIVLSVFIGFTYGLFHLTPIRFIVLAVISTSAASLFLLIATGVLHLSFHLLFWSFFSLLAGALVGALVDYYNEYSRSTPHLSSV